MEPPTGEIEAALARIGREIWKGPYYRVVVTITRGLMTVAYPTTP